LPLGETRTRGGGRPAPRRPADDGEQRGSAPGEPRRSRRAVPAARATADHRPFTLRCVAAADVEGLTIIGERIASTGELDAVETLQDVSNHMAVMARESARKTRELEESRRELQAALDDLQSMYWHVRKMQDYLPICMQCGKVKSADRTWIDAATFLQKESTFLTHGCCPSCAERFLADLDSLTRS
jgi:hypothetical protein